MSRPPTSFSTAVLFAGLCLAWGSGWMALKIGVAALPPVLFAASRFLAAGAVLLAFVGLRGGVRGLARLPVREALPGAGLMIAVNYGLMAWGVTRVGSGLAAVVNLTTVPLAMAAFGALHGQSAIHRRTAAGLIAGSCGLAVLFLPTVAGTLVPSLAPPAAPGGSAAGPAAWGLAAIAAGAAAYAWGSVLTRRGRASASALELATVQALLGGGALLAVSAAGESWSGIGSAIAEPVRLGGWLFLVAISVASTPAYLALLARWEPARVAAYAYICPVIALAEGMAFGGESLSAVEGGGAVLLGLSAYGVLGAPKKPVSAAQPDAAEPPSAPVLPLRTP
jgi:drug/metabolite transporter (DMT)-like permease